MQAEIIAGQKARLALHFLGLHQVDGFYHHAPTDRTAIGFCADQFYLEP
jgi:hypothetical protein